MSHKQLTCPVFSVSGTTEGIRQLTTLYHKICWTTSNHTKEKKTSYEHTRQQKQIEFVIIELKSSIEFNSSEFKSKESHYHYVNDHLIITILFRVLKLIFYVSEYKKTLDELSQVCLCPQNPPNIFPPICKSSNFEFFQNMGFADKKEFLNLRI